MDSYDNDTILFQQVIAAYGYVGFLIDKGEKGAARSQIHWIKKQCQDLKSGSFEAEVYAVEAGLVGYEITLSPLRAPFLGPRNQAYIDYSMEVDSLNPFVWMEKGNTCFYAPQMFGGSYKKAARMYEKAVKLFEASDKKYPSWVCLNARVMWGKSCLKQKDYLCSERVFEETLHLHPDFRWVRDELLPQVRAILVENN
jgi:hypothetical protein